MFSVRKNTFETNSSSTHCLCYEKSVELKSEDLEKLKEAYIIKPYTQEEIDDVMEITSIKAKLRYFYTLYIQANHTSNKFMRKLKNIVPNVIFSEEFPDETYILEDGDSFMEGGYFAPAEYEILTDDLLTKLLLYGKIYFGDRDRESYSDKVYDIEHSDAYFSMVWSG